MNCARCGSPPDMPSCTQCPTLALHPAQDLPHDLDPADGQQGPVPIGGWLILAAVGLVATPLRLTHEVLTKLLPQVSGPAWEVLTTPGSDAYRPALAGLLVLDIVANGLFVACTVVTCVAFFQRRRYVPRLMIAFWVAQLLYVLLVDTLLLQLLVEGAAMTKPSTLAMAVLKTVAWCAYFQRSTRVKRTFLR
jgi:hypothetical protein